MIPLDKVTPDNIMTVLWVGAALVAFELSVWTLVDKIKKAAEWKRDMNRKLDSDNKRIESLEEGNKAICRGVLALLSHEINGNSVDKLTSARDGLTEYLIER
jgi:hypothetical protein